MILPALFAFMNGSTALVMKNVPLRLTSIRLSQSASVVSSIGAMSSTPALLTRMSMVPNAAATSPARRSQSATIEISA